MEKRLQTIWGKMWEVHQQAKDTLFFFSQSALRAKEKENVNGVHSDKGKHPVAPKLKTGQKIGLGLGPLLFLFILFYFPAEGLSNEGLATLAITVWIATWWVTEALPIPVTSLLPILLFPVFGIVAAD